MIPACRTAAIGLAVLVGLAVTWCCLASLGFLAGTGLWGHPAIPTYSYPWQWLVYRQDFGRNNVTTVWLVVSAVVGFTPVPVVIRRMSGLRAKPKLHGETHWLTQEEAEADNVLFLPKPRPDAVLLGTTGKGRALRYVCLPGQEHAALYARTGAGKGVSFVVPNVMNWGGSVVCFSVKRDVADVCAAERAKQDDKVFIFDLTGADGRTHRWNPLGAVPRGTSAVYNECQKAMFGIIPQTKAQNPYWDNAARRIGTAAAVVLSETPGAALNVGSVRRLLGRSDYAENLRGMVRASRRENRPYPAAAVDTLLTWLAREGEDGAASVRETIATALALYELPEIMAGTDTSDFDVSMVRTTKMSIFVVASVGDIRRLRPIYAQFFQQFVSRNTLHEFGKDTANKHHHPVLVMLDEFWALGEVPILADAAAFTRSFGFRFAYVIQSKHQTVTAFGPEGSKNLFLNTGAELLFGGADQELAEEVSKRGGTDTVEEVTTSKPRFMAWLNWSRQNENEQRKGRALMLPQEVSRMDKREMIVLRPGMAPLKLDRIFYFEDREFMTREQLAPTWPRLTVQVELDDAAGALAKEKAEADAALAVIRQRQGAKEMADKEKADKVAAALAKLQKEASDAAKLAQAAVQKEVMAAAEALTAAKVAAAATETARQAREVATETSRVARKANETLAAAVALGPPPPVLSATVLPAVEKATECREAARITAAAASEATEAARVARARATAATQNAKNTRKKADALASLLASKKDAP